jgi:hypothetical protein
MPAPDADAVPVALDRLQPGDVLLMLGHGELSKMIAWCGDSLYSHAAIVADQGDLIEAAGSGVRRYPLARRVADTGEYFFIDALRPLARDGSAFTDLDRAAVLAHAQSLLGVPYPLDSLATLGVLVAVRGKWPQHWLARLLVREALDHLVRDDPSHMVCSEVVYRALAECDVQPRGRLAPLIVLEAPTHAPFPQVDWVALWREVWPLLHPQRQAALADVATHAEAATSGREPAPMPPAPTLQVGDDDLQRSLMAARAALGIRAPLPLQAGDAGALSHEAVAAPPPTPIPDPNPKLVTPLDLATTPSHHVIGRLMQAPASVPRD